MDHGNGQLGMGNPLSELTLTPVKAYYNTRKRTKNWGSVPSIKGNSDRTTNFIHRHVFGESEKTTSRTSIKHVHIISSSLIQYLYNQTSIHTVQYSQARLWPFQRFDFFLLEPFHYTFCGTLVDLLYNFLYSIYCTYAQMILWREYLIIYRDPFSVFLFVEGRAYWRERGKGRAWSQIIRPRKSLALYKSFNTFWYLWSLSLLSLPASIRALSCEI